MAVSFKIFFGERKVARGLRIGSRLDKYRLVKKLGYGGFATVYSALDQIENRQVAIKVPEEKFVADAGSLADLQREVRIMAKLEHEHIVPLKDARFIDGRFVMVFPLGQESLASRMQRRLAHQTAIDFVHQMVASVAFAHSNKVLHRDVKPENFILYANNQLKLTDFGLARIQTGRANQSASGTLAYMAPEQAMGRPTFRSDVFSLGLVIYRMFSGQLPEYPFEWPLPGATRARRVLSPEFLELIRKAIDPVPSKRFRDAIAMQNALAQIRQPLKTVRGKATASSTSRRSTRQRNAA